MHWSVIVLCGEEGTVHSVGGSGLGASDNGNLHNGDAQRDERLRAVRRHAERAARELDQERNDSVLHLAQALGGIDRDEMTAQFEARLGFLERQVERLVGRREEVDRAIHGELKVMRSRVGEALSAVEAAGEADRQAREALEARVQAALEGSERRSEEAARALRETLLTSWEHTVQSERARAGRSHMEALERELTERADVARKVMAEIRQSLDSQVAVTVQAAQAVAEAALGGVTDRLVPPAPPATYQPPAARTLDGPPVWEIEAG
jgi:hypothetical protein